MAEDNNNQNEKDDDALGGLRQMLAGDSDSNETKQEGTNAPARPLDEQEQEAETEPATIPKDTPAHAKKTRSTAPFVFYIASLFMALGALIFVGSQSYRMGMRHASEQKQQEKTQSAQTIKNPVQPQSRSPHHDVARMVEQTRRPQPKQAEQKKPQPKKTTPTTSATAPVTKQPRTSTSEESLARIKKEIALIKKRQQNIQASLKKQSSTTKKQQATAAKAIPPPIAKERQQPISNPAKQAEPLSDAQKTAHAIPSPLRKTTPPPPPASTVRAQKNPENLTVVTLTPPPKSIARNVPALSPEERNRYRIQLGAHRNKIDTHNQWLKVLYKHSQVLAPYEARVDRLVRNQAPQSIYYRLQVIGFPNKTTAQNICAQLKRRRENCWVVTPENNQTDRSQQQP